MSTPHSTRAGAAGWNPPGAAAHASATVSERERVAGIYEIGETHGLRAEAHHAISNGTSLEAFRAQALEVLRGRRSGALFPPTRGERAGGSGVIDGLDRVLRALYNDDTATRAEGGSNRATVPWSELRGQRSGATTQDFLGAISTDAHVEEAAPALREQSILVRLGARVLSGLTGTVDIPVVEGAVAKIGTETAAEGGETPTEATNVQLSPESGRAFTPISRRIMVQTGGGIQAVVKDDLLGAIAELIDAVGIAAILDSATPVPSSGGSSPADVDHFADAIALRTALELGKYPAKSRAYIAHPVTIGTLSLPYVAGGVAFPPPFIGTPQDGRINGTPCGQSSLVDSLAYFEASELFIGLWGPGVELDLGPADNAGVRYLRAWVEFDAKMRRPAATIIGEASPSE